MLENMVKPTMTHIKPEEALPFIRVYNDMFSTAVVDEKDVTKCVWLGFEVEGALRGVLGLQPLADSVFVWGMFGDGSRSLAEYKVGVYMGRVVDGLPFDLSGAILPANVAQKRRAERHGWTKADSMIMCGTNDELQELWTRPWKGKD